MPWKSGIWTITGQKFLNLLPNYSLIENDFRKRRSKALSSDL